MVHFILLNMGYASEMQSIIYQKVKQQASIELSEKTYAHLHSLSLNWHLTKKMGNVVRSLDRGTDAADTLGEHRNRKYTVSPFRDNMGIAVNCSHVFVLAHRWQCQSRQQKEKRKYSKHIYLVHVATNHF